MPSARSPRASDLEKRGAAYSAAAGLRARGLDLVATIASASPPVAAATANLPFDFAFALAFDLALPFFLGAADFLPFGGAGSATAAAFAPSAFFARFAAALP